MEKSLPEARLSAEEVLKQAQYFSDIPFFQHLIDSVSDIVLILNETRQIVLANQHLYDRFHVNEAKVIGLRPGECMDCIHGLETSGGCGTTNFCRACGAARAIFNRSITCETDVQECRIRRKISPDSLDLRVRAVPLQIRDQSFTIFVLTDIRDEKRRQALEQVFFQDILKMAWNLAGVAELLQSGYPEKRQEYEKLILHTAQNLVKEINRQKLLGIAEDDDLIVAPAVMNSADFLRETEQFYREQKPSDNGIVLAENIAAVEFVSDRNILGRVLENMLDNALESVQSGEKVTLGCESDAETVTFWVHNPGEMPEEARLQVFQRSFSTRAKGRGLGTYTIRLLSERYLKGRVSFTTSKEKGTVFRASYPISLNP
ncbi:MAG: sensor histidine kinase [Desulfococcaceae bacterium]